MIEAFLQDVRLSISDWLFSSLRDIAMRALLSFFLIIIVFSFRNIFLAFISKKGKEPTYKLQLKKNSSYISAFLIILILIPVWLPSIQNFLAVIGIFGAGFIIVMKESIVNITGWLYLMIRRPFEEGNRIEIGSYIGDVIEIRLQEFSMIEVRSRDHGGQSTGRVLHVPNSMIFTSVLANASKEFSFSWNEMRIPLTPSSDWEKAVKIIEETAKNTIEKISREDQRILHSENTYAIRYSRLEPGVYVEFYKGAIVVTLRHLVEPRKLRQTTDLIWRSLLISFKNDGSIELSPHSENY